MGFCLLEHAVMPGIYFAVNPEHVVDVKTYKITEDQPPTCILSFSIDIAPFEPLVLGTKEQVQGAMMEGLKIGLNKVDLNILTGSASQSRMPLLLNNPGRIVLVREMNDDEFVQPETASATASQMFFIEGMTRIIVQRPALFATMANQGGDVPMVRSEAA